MAVGGRSLCHIESGFFGFDFGLALFNRTRAKKIRPRYFGDGHCLGRGFFLARSQIRPVTLNFLILTA